MASYQCHLHNEGGGGVTFVLIAVCDAAMPKQSTLNLLFHYGWVERLTKSRAD
jgi:hypothetical protein